jgi:thiamine-monophosphate kinase
VASEFALIAALRRRLPAASGEVLLGPGDDAALVAPPLGQGQVLSTDTLVAGRHFPPGLPPELLAWRALAVNLSDLAAMGATPGPYLVALTAPDLTEAWIEGFCDGLLGCTARYAPSAQLVGGNLARGPLQVSVTVTGWVPPGQALLRSGARPGDRLFVSGRVGQGLAARQALGETALQPLGLVNCPVAFQPYLMPAPRVALGLALRGQATAAIDISDGLAAELRHLAEASGVSLKLEADAIPVQGDRIAALQGGDDYELLFTLPAERSTPERLAALARAGGVALSEIGQCEIGPPALQGLPDLPREGWDHFAGEAAP